MYHKNLKLVSYGCAVCSTTAEYDSSALLVHGNVLGTGEIDANRLVIAAVVVASSAELRVGFQIAERPVVAGVGRSDAVVACTVTH